MVFFIKFDSIVEMVRFWNLTKRYVTKRTVRMNSLDKRICFDHAYDYDFVTFKARNRPHNYNV